MTQQGPATCRSEKTPWGWKFHSRGSPTQELSSWDIFEPHLLIYLVILANKEQGPKRQGFSLAGGSTLQSIQGCSKPKTSVRATKQGGHSQLHKSLKAATPKPSRARNGKKLSLEGRTGGGGGHQEITVVLTPHPALLTSSIFYKSVAIISKHYTNTPIAPRSQQQEQKQR